MIILYNLATIHDTYQFHYIFDEMRVLQRRVLLYEGMPFSIFANHLFIYEEIFTVTTHIEIYLQRILFSSLHILKYWV